jgi:hypothetical protein
MIKWKRKNKNKNKINLTLNIKPYDSSLWFCGRLVYIMFIVGWFGGRIWQQLSHAISLLDCTFPFLFQHQLPHAISRMYISFPIPIRGLWILIYTIPFLFQYTIFKYLIIYNATIELTKLSCHIFIVTSSQKISLALYRMFQICFSIIFSMPLIFGWIYFPHMMFLCFPYVIFSF